MRAPGKDRGAGTPDSQSERDLIARAQRGEETAFATLFEMHQRRVYAVCLRMTRNPAEAEDLTQEAFLQVFRTIRTFRGDSALGTWLHRLVVNLVLMHLRKKRARRETAPEQSQDAQRPRVELGRIDATLAASLDRILLHRAIASLPSGYRTVFLRHDVEGYEHQEIARMMKWSVGNSKSQLHKARQRLRDYLLTGKPAGRRRAKAGAVARPLEAHQAAPSLT
jgi:RNA polymerase sigma-70 factor (ECF subfamily)